MSRNKKNSSKPKATMYRRMLITVLVFVAVGFLPLTVRLAYLQLINYEENEAKAVSQQMRDTEISSNRGTIYDSNMNILAKSSTAWTIAISPKDVLPEQRDAIAADLAEILGLDAEDIKQRYEYNSYYEVMKRKVSDDVADQVRAVISENKYRGVNIYEDSKRYYPYGTLASSVIGFVGTDNQGLYGLEAYYDEYLSGVSGREIAAKNAWGGDMPYEYSLLYEATDGYSLVTTIDYTIQYYLEKNLDYAMTEHNAKNGIGIVMDVNTGAIYGMANYPNFDCNDPFTVDEATMTTINALTGDERSAALSAAREAQWKNYAITYTYEPGSVFKVVTASAALETGVCSLSSTFNCTGSIRVASETMSCAHREGHGHQNFTQAVVNSCNPAFITIGQMLGASNFYSYYKAFGLAEKTGVNLPGEVGGIYYTDKTLGIVELASCSYGQSNTVTPLQMITAVCAASNGGYLVQPYVVSSVLDDEGNLVQSYEPTVKRQVISEETSAQICTIMEQVVSTSTGRNAYVMGYRVGGKSGTSEKLGGDADARIASFVGIAPSDDPQIAVLIILDEPNSYSSYGAVLAGPVVGAVMSEVLPYLGVEPVYSEGEQAKIESAVPSVEGVSLTDAQSDLLRYGLYGKIIGNGQTVVEQFPSAGQSVSREGTVILYTEPIEDMAVVSMPSVVGRSAAEAREILRGAGLNIKISGGGIDQSGATAVAQSTAAGESVALGTIITVEFVNTGIVDD